MSTESDIAALKADIARLQEQFRAIPSRWGGSALLHFVQMGSGNTIGTYGGVVIKGLKKSSTAITVLPTLTPGGTVTDGLSYGQIDQIGNVWVSSRFTLPSGTTINTLEGNYPTGSIVLVGAPYLMPVTGSTELRPLYPIIKI